MEENGKLPLSGWKKSKNDKDSANDQLQGDQKSKGTREYTVTI